MEEQGYYIYIYLNQTKPGLWVYKNHAFQYEPFYVGKGVNNRINEHLRPYMLKKKSFKSSVIKSILDKTGEQPIRYKLYDGLTNEDVIAIEKDIIRHFGRRDNNSGILTNCTDGGDGANGLGSDVRLKMGVLKKKKVYQYSLNGDFIKAWDSLSEIDLPNSCNIATAIKRNGTFGGYLWSYKYLDKLDARIKWQAPIKYINIQQIEPKTGTIIKVFESALEIEKELNLRVGARNKIYECLKGKLKTAYGYKWQIQE